MDNSFAPNNQYNQNQNNPQNSQPGQPNPQINMTFGPDGRPVTGVQLETPILSPTQTAENLRNYRQPQLAQPAAAKTPVVNSTSLTLLSIVLGIFAIAGLALGIFGLIDSAATNTKLEEARAELTTKNAIVEEVSKQTGVQIKTAKDVPTFKATTGYIYLSEWGIKIQIPSELHQISYILNNRLYHPTICFNGVETAITNPLPAFTDVVQNPGGMGCLVRVSAEEGERGTDGLSFGEKVYSDSGYNYFYQTPNGIFSKDNSEIQLETHAVALIKTMLSSENLSTYK